MNVVRKSGGNIHRIREFELEKVSLAEEFDILQIVGEGWFGKILLVEHRTTDAEMVLKALPKPYVSLRDFYREFHYGLHLGVHKNIVTTFDVAFETAGFYVFTQEYAPLGDLTSNVSDSGIGELHTKRVAKQIAAALDFMHSKDLVHRDVKLDNVLIFRSDFSRVKLCDFGESRRNGTLVQRRNEWLPYSPPEVLSVPTDDTYKTDFSHDVWQFGIVVFVCLTGCLPWQKAAADDPRYMRYILWHSATLSFPLRRTPKLFKLASSRACKLFRKILEPRPDKRPKSLSDISKFLDDRWLSKGAEKDMIAMEPDELCPSMYSFHSNPEEKSRLLSTLIEYGIEPTVDRVAKKARIRDWIQSSVITEENEEEEETNSSGRNSPNIIFNRTPIAGHISSIRAEEAAQKKIVSTIKDATNKHYDPRTGLEQAGPSLMGAASPVDNPPINGTYTNGNGGSRRQTPDREPFNQNENNFGNFNYHNNDPSGQQNYSISQQYSSSLVSESGEQTQVDARLNVPIHNKLEHNLRPPLREHRSKKSTATQIFGKSKSFKEPRTSSHGLLTAVNSMPLDSGQIVMDNGYGSMDRIKMTNDSTLIPLSPILVKRSSIKSSSDSGSLNVQNNSNPSSKDHSPFDSDYLDIESIRGSTGFVNFSGMKDSPYDHVTIPTKRK